MMIGFSLSHTSMRTLPSVTLASLMAHYDALLLDAYGVLVSLDGAMPGAADPRWGSTGTRSGPAPAQATETAIHPVAPASGWGPIDSTSSFMFFSRKPLKNREVFQTSCVL